MMKVNNQINHFVIENYQNNAREQSKIEAKSNILDDYNLKDEHEYRVI